MPRRGAASEQLTGGIRRQCWLTDDRYPEARCGEGVSDGTIHLAFEHSVGQVAGAQSDAKPIETFIRSLAGSGKPLVISGATVCRSQG